MGIISYSQNFEDVMLWRALGHVEAGFYIDIGAQDPVTDSVSKAFHDRGWQGIHVEPVAHYANLLRQQRPGDLVVQAAVGGTSDMLRFFEIPGTGISTASPKIAKEHRERGFETLETSVPSISLSALFKLAADRPIHWLKVDVEGFEKEALVSWEKSPARPWIIVVESTTPMTTVESHSTWERLLLRRKYQPAYFDGLNRFYVSADHPELLNAFRLPPGVFDGFAISGGGSSSFHVAFRQQMESNIDRLVAEQQSEVARLAAKSNAESEAIRALLGDAKKANARLEKELEKVKGSQRGRDKLNMAAMAKAQSDLKKVLKAEYAWREADAATALKVARGEVRELQAEKAELAEQQAAGLQALEALRSNALARERDLEGKIEVLLREQKLREQVLQERADQARKSVDSLLRSLAEREHAAELKLLLMQQQFDSEKQANKQAHTSSLAKLAEENATTVRRLKAELERAQLENANARALSQSRHAALEVELQEQRDRIAAFELDAGQMRKMLHEQQSKFVHELRAAQEHAARDSQQQRELAESRLRHLSDSHVADVAALNKTINEYRMQTADLAAERIKQEQAWSELSSHQRAQIAALELTIKQRDESFGAKVDALQAEVEAYKASIAELRREHKAEIASKDASHNQELHVALNREKALAQDVTALRSLNTQLAMVRESLTLKLHAERSALLEADRLLAEIQADVSAMVSSISWRITLPLRWFASYKGPRRVEIKQPLREAIPALEPAPPVGNANEQQSAGSELDATDIDPFLEGDDMNPTTDGSNSPTPSNLEELIACQDVDFVRNAYRVLLKREPDPEGQANYLALVRRGYDKLQIISDISQSEEGQRVGVKLAGLESAVRSKSRMQRPITGAFFRMLNVLFRKQSVIDGTAAFESQAIALQREATRRVGKLGSSVTRLQESNLELADGIRRIIESHESIARRLDQVSMALETIRNAPPVGKQDALQTSGVESGGSAKDETTASDVHANTFRKQLEHRVAAWKT